MAIRLLIGLLSFFDELSDQKPILMDFSESMSQSWKPYVKEFFFVCPEDDASRSLAQIIDSFPRHGEEFPLIAREGTSILLAHIRRVRFDFRRFIINGSFSPLLKPSLISPSQPVHTHLSPPPQVIHEYTSKNANHSKCLA